jgi:hypothetical protein
VEKNWRKAKYERTGMHQYTQQYFRENQNQTTNRNMSTVKGNIKIINDAQTYGSFTKREFILTTEDKYPQDLKFELYQDNCGDIDPYAVGDTIDVNYNLKGNEYKGKYYVNLQAWKLNAPGSDSAEPPQTSEEEAPDLTKGDEELEDAPF